MRLMGRMGLMRRASPPKGRTLGTTSMALAFDGVAAHELGDEEGTQHVVLLLSNEAKLGSGTLGGVGHLGLGVVGRVAEELTLGQHAGSDGGRRIAEFGDVRLLGETVHAEIDIGVATGFAVDSLHGEFKFHFLILGHNKKRFRLLIIGRMGLQARKTEEDLG